MLIAVNAIPTPLPISEDDDRRQRLAELHRTTCANEERALADVIGATVKEPLLEVDRRADALQPGDLILVSQRWETVRKVAPDENNDERMNLWLGARELRPWWLYVQRKDTVLRTRPTVAGVAVIDPIPEATPEEEEAASAAMVAELGKLFPRQPGPPPYGTGPSSPNEPFLFHLAVLAAEGEIAAALDYLYTTVDDLLRTGRFADVDTLLACVPVKLFGEDLLVGFLSITVAASDKLAFRDAFLERVRAHLADSMVPAELDALLQGLCEKPASSTTLNGQA